jgi:biopolymer transport protein ExbD
MLGRISFSLLFAVVGMGLWIGVLAQSAKFYEGFAKNYYVPLIFPNGLPAISVILADSTFGWSILRSFLGGATLGWMVGGADAAGWRFHLRAMQWAGLTFALGFSGAMAESIYPFADSTVLLLDPTKWSSSIRTDGMMAGGMVLGWASTWSIFLAAFWWGKEIDSIAIIEQTESVDVGRMRHKRALLHAIGCGSTHPGYVIVLLMGYPMLWIGLIWAAADLRDRYSVLPRVEYYLGRTIKTSMAEIANTDTSVTVMIAADGTLIAEGQILGTPRDHELLLATDWIKHRDRTDARLTLVIRADSSVRLQRLINVLDAASRARVSHFCLLGMDDE